MSDSSSGHHEPHGKAFYTTRWSVVQAAGRRSSPEAREALAVLCAAYWYPLYAYVRRQGRQVAEAQDLTQGFFSHLLEKGSLQAADPHRGRFRSFLLAALNHYMANERRRAAAGKRGGGTTTLSLDLDDAERRYAREPAQPETPERIYERQWAMTLLEQAIGTLRSEYEAQGKCELFQALSIYLGGTDRSVPYGQLAERLGMSPGAVKTAVHRLRQRCRQCLRQEIAQTVASPDEVDEELNDLFAALGR